MNILEYLVSRSGSTVLNRTLNGVESAVNVATIGSLGESKAGKFAHDVRALVSSDEFVTQLSEDIGEPIPAETEDEYVERAKQKMRDLLMAKLK
ncbi:hypothetical protein [Pseudomonas sp. HY13-MNA-CIBAN-0226]|uniref:hypothetical protein n=1 Tax=Pseudomonas sp. HY13-MNA-CIBAN-0226 TaxID=3140473 RepID=UPI00332BD9F6